MSLRANAQDLTYAQHKCHNCRRQRLRCDRTIPACHKCVNLGKECLGYGKLFIWTDAVASRGRRAGKQTFAPAGPSSTTQGSASTAVVKSTPSSVLSSRSQPSSASEDSVGQHDALLLHVLVDPVLQDYDQVTRYYLNYYVDRVAGDLVVYDIPGRNPFRNLVPMCRKHAFLQHAVVAMSAVHHVTLLRSRGLPHQRRLFDALVSRQQALRLVKNALSHLDSRDYGDLLTAVVFLVNFDLVDSGRDSWKAHVGAAGRLMTLLQQSATVSPVDPSVASLGDYIMSDCLTYFILGSTLSSWEGTGAAEVFSSLDVISMLERAETNSYHSCPSEILTAILRSSQLVAKLQPGGECTDFPFLMETASGLMRQLLLFDARRWAEHITFLCDGGSATEAQILSREHMASAHRSAACAYLAMAAPWAFAHLDPAPSPEDYALEIFGHLSCIPETDMLFKGSVWPTFVLGAQTADPEKRAWVVARLGCFWVSMCPWGYVKTALETLEALWRFRDSTPGVADDRRDWLSELKAVHVDCLIV